MKIALFTDCFVPQVNGIVVHCLELGERLAKRGHSVHFFAPEPPSMKVVPSLPEHCFLHFCSGIGISSDNSVKLTSPLSFKMIELIHAIKPDILHFHTTFTIGNNAILLSKMFGIPLVGTFHTYFMEPERFPTIGLDKIGIEKSEIISTLGWHYSNYFFNQADVVISPSEYTKKMMKEHGVTKPIKVISNGIDLTISKNKTKHTFDQLRDLPSYFLYVGRVSHEKSIDVLIKAYAQAQRKNSAIPPFVIVGDGPTLKSLKEQAVHLKLGERVIFLGNKEHTELMNSTIFEHALAFVTASKSENQAISVLEALKFGLPLIVVRATSMPELVKDNGIVCEPDNVQDLANAFQVLASDKKMVQTMHKHSLRLIQKHNIEESINQLEELYTVLMKKFHAK